jgi:hypothetical protein
MPAPLKDGDTLNFAVAVAYLAVECLFILYKQLLMHLLHPVLESHLFRAKLSNRVFFMFMKGMCALWLDSFIYSKLVTSAYIPCSEPKNTFKMSIIGLFAN